MECPNCGSLESVVSDTRYKGNIKQKQRKRKCKECHMIFMTLEKTVSDLDFPRIVKRDNRREDFNCDKLRKSILLAVAKRPITTRNINQLITNTVKHFVKTDRKEIHSTELGRIVMRNLIRLDRVAYIRFASVYRNFKDIGAFKDEVEYVKSKENLDTMPTQKEFHFDEKI